MPIYSRLALIKDKIEACKRFLEGIEAGEYHGILKEEAENDLRYWQAELAKHA